MEYLSDEGYRFDGRKVDEFRQIKGRLGVYDHADGSAILQQGNTKILAAVFGPREPKGSQVILVLDFSSENDQIHMEHKLTICS